MAFANSFQQCFNKFSTIAFFLGSEVGPFIVSVDGLRLWRPAVCAGGKTSVFNDERNENADGHSEN